MAACALPANLRQHRSGQASDFSGLVRTVHASARGRLGLGGEKVKGRQSIVFRSVLGCGSNVNGMLLGFPNFFCLA